MARIPVTPCQVNFILGGCYCSTGHSQVRLVVIICIDPPLAAHPNLPRITIQHWKPFSPTPPPRAGSHARQIEGRKVWEADWTHAVTNYYILLADVFPAAIPAIYGAATRVVFSPATLALWRQQIIDRWQ